MIFMNCLIFNGSLTFFRAVIMERYVGWRGFNVKYIGISPIGELRCCGAMKNAKKWHWDKHQVKKGWKMFLLFTFSFPSLSICSDLSLNWRLRCGGALFTLAHLGDAWQLTKRQWRNWKAKKLLWSDGCPARNKIVLRLLLFSIEEFDRTEKKWKSLIAHRSPEICCGRSEKQKKRNRFHFFSPICYRAIRLFSCESKWRYS